MKRAIVSSALVLVFSSIVSAYGAKPLGNGGLGLGKPLGGPLTGALGGGLGHGGGLGGGLGLGGPIGGGLGHGGALGGGLGGPLGGGGLAHGGALGGGGLAHGGALGGGIGLGGIGGGLAPIGASCRYWCRTPEQQVYCCEDNNEHLALPSVKPGICPPVRPQCPPVRNFAPPLTCSNDSKCPGAEKCCFDRCLEHHTCKLPTW